MDPPMPNDSSWAVSDDCLTEIRRKVEINQYKYIHFVYNDDESHVSMGCTFAVLIVNIV